MAFSHRDRRAHRAVWRGLAALAVGELALGTLALFAPRAWVGLIAVAALGAIGLAALDWGLGLVDRYATDLRRAREGGPLGGFERVEALSRFDLDRPVGRPTALSPHARRRTPERRRDEEAVEELKSGGP